jgi:hypothetical protein
MTKANPPTPAWLIERLAQGELDAATADDVRARLRAEGRSAEEAQAALAASNREVLALLPPHQVAASVRARLAATRDADRVAAARAGRRHMWLVTFPTMGAMAAAAVLALLLLARRPPDPGDRQVARPAATNPEESIISKGGPRRDRLLIYRQSPQTTERLEDGARAARGDYLQLAYVVGDAGYGVVVSLDGAGKVTLHLPDAPTGTAVALKNTGEVRIPRSYELDDAPRFERFYLVRAAAPFPVAQVVDAARSLAASAGAGPLPKALPLPAGFSQTSIHVAKQGGTK